MRVLERVAEDLARDRPKRARARLRRALVHHGKAPTLWLRYAELSARCRPDVLETDPPAERPQQRRVWAAFPLELAEGSVENSEIWRKIMLHRAVALGRQGDFDQAFASVNRAVRREDPESVACLRTLAAEAVVAARLADAARLLELARALMPQDPIVPRELGLVLLAQGHARAALEQLQEAFAANPRQLEPRRDAAYALASSGRAQEGYELLSRERKTCGELPSCLAELARLALEAGLLGAAESHAAELTRRAPNDSESWLLLAEAKSRQGDAAAARRVYQHVLSLDPENARAREALRSPDSALAPTPAQSPLEGDQREQR